MICPLLYDDCSKHCPWYLEGCNYPLERVYIDDIDDAYLDDPDEAYLDDEIYQDDDLPFS